MRVAIVLGKKLTPTGDPNGEYKRSLAIAEELLFAKAVDFIAISGGKTQAAFPAEADVGYHLLSPESQRVTILESSSLSGVENIVELRKLLGEDVHSSFMIMGHARLSRMRKVLKRFWKEADITCIGVQDDHPILERVKEAIISIIFGIDPEQKHITALLKKMFRNA